MGKFICLKIKIVEHRLAGPKSGHCAQADKSLHILKYFSLQDMTSKKSDAELKSSLGESEPKASQGTGEKTIGNESSFLGNSCTTQSPNKKEETSASLAKSKAETESKPATDT